VESGHPSPEPAARIIHLALKRSSFCKMERGHLACCRRDPTRNGSAGRMPAPHHRPTQGARKGRSYKAFRTIHAGGAGATGPSNRWSRRENEPCAKEGLISHHFQPTMKLRKRVLKGSDREVKLWPCHPIRGTRVGEARRSFCCTWKRSSRSSGK